MHNPTKCFLCSDFGKTTENGVEKQTVFWGDARKAFKGPRELFTGDVQLSLLFPPNKTAQYSGAHGTFQPGARTAWHIHPAGQYITGVFEYKNVVYKEKVTDEQYLGK